MDDLPPATSTAEEPTGVAVPLLMMLCALVWLIATPVLLFGAAIVSAPFFGETPSADEMAQSRLLLMGAFATGTLAPAAGLALALRSPWRWSRWGFGIVLALSATVVLGAGVLWLSDQPAAEPPEQHQPVCQERSGGTSDCPGG